ncbi:MAG: SDR family NAD(P)-dependent oxidoreductase [Hyphomicrobiales bacterium]
MDLGLSGRRALVTGGSQGIGFACAKLLAQEGCDLVLAARGEEALARAKAEIEGLAPKVRVETEASDLSKDEAVPGLAGRHGERIDILINNAGAIPGGTLADIDQARWRAAWELKMFGYIGMTRAFYASMAVRRKGCHHQHHRLGRRAHERFLHRRLDRQCRADGVHPRARSR